MSRDTLCLEIRLSISSRRKMRFPLSMTSFPTLNGSLELYHWWSINLLFDHSSLPVLLQPPCTENLPNSIPLHLTRINKLFYGRSRAVCPCEECLAWQPIALSGKRVWAQVPLPEGLSSRNTLISVLKS